MRRLPRNDKELAEIFRNAKEPELSEFNGEYEVDMLTKLPSLRRFSHRKVFSVEKDGMAGCNVLFRNQKWGHFFLEEGICHDPGPLKVIVINYDRRENTILTRGIRDFVRCVEDGNLYLGRFNVMLGGKLRFFGFFSLTKL
jgi:hypothetical protein